MSIFDRFKKQQKRTASDVMFANWAESESINLRGYTPLSKCPEVLAAVDRISDLIASMTIYLMENGKNGDKRIRNELSRKVDIHPYSKMTRYAWMKWIVNTMLIQGDGNAIVMPKTRAGLLDELVPIPASKISFLDRGDDYRVLINGTQFDPNNLLHFVLNPDPDYPWKGKGYKVSVQDIVDNLKQATATQKAFMSSKWKPSVIIKVDAMVDEFSDPESRKKILDDYVKTNEAGEPWLIPGEQFDVQQIKPLTLNDLAISNTVELDKKTVASIFGVPPFVLGIGNFDRNAWNNFVKSRLMPIAKAIEQELTRKLLMRNEWYFKFNSRSLYSYDMSETAEMSSELYVRGIMTGNEVRNMLDMSPLEGLDELVILENYVPIDRLGDQKKLVQKGGEGDE